jgi:hypothetical protein
LKYRMATDEVKGTYSGPGPQRLVLRFHPGPGTDQVTIAIAGPLKDTVRTQRLSGKDPSVEITLPASPGVEPSMFSLYPSGR